MSHDVWARTLKGCADPKRARHYLDQLRAGAARDALEAMTEPQATVLAALLSGSEALSEWLLQHPEWLEPGLDPEALRHPRRRQGLRREVDRWLPGLLRARDYSGALDRLRGFKQREQWRIALRDLARLGRADEITRELSDLADLCLDTVYAVCRSQLGERFGGPWHQDPEGGWHPTEFCVLGLGKLGGQELNYSSDIDLMFVYSEEGWAFRERPVKGSSTGKGLPNHQFFQRLVEGLVAELTRLTPQGSLYRVDLRLRPEGDRGPLARSLASYENYYAQWGQTWERMMLIKARGVAGDESLAAEFLELVQPFRYPRSLPERILREIAAMKARIEAEVVRTGEIDRNVKLGRGGIREIEFTVQSLQLVHAGRLPFLQGAQTLPTLVKLAQYHRLQETDARALTEAYLFLRDIEHRLQMENHLQTHTIPEDRAARARLAALLGFASVRAFQALLREHTSRVRALYEATVRGDTPAEPQALPAEFAGRDDDWKRLLAEHSFQQVDQSLGVLRTFVEGPGYVHLSPRTVDLGTQLVTRLFSLCPHRQPDGTRQWPRNALSDPDRVLARLDTFVSAYGSRAMLYETWASNPSLFELMVLLFDRSEFLAETAIRTPDLVEDLVLSGHLRRRKTGEQILEELRHGHEDEDQLLWLRRYHQAEFMRLGLRDILGLADYEQNLVELSGLAEACLQYALEAVLRRHRLRKPPFALVGLGKLGGTELTYGSDLDLLFVADPRVKNLPAVQRLAAEVMEMLSSPTELGVAFKTDARLRPDGAKGLLVNTLSAYEDYYRRRAMLWEIQALTRCRAIGGDPAVGRRFETLAAELACFRDGGSGVAAYGPDWRQQIARMRLRIEKERTPAGKDPLAFKTGAGGLIDAEFIGQALCLAEGWREPNTLKALERARDSGVLPRPAADTLLENYKPLLRMECILRRWSFEGESVLPDDPAPQYRVAVRCGLHTAGELLAAVAGWRREVRSVYQTVFPPDP